MMMQQRLRRFAPAAVALGLLLAPCACTDWSTHKKWPRKHEFQGQAVELHRGYRVGDYDVPDAVPGQDPAKFHTYYAYMKDGKEVLHGRATWWYDERKPKAQVVYVHGKKQSRTSYYRDGKVRERVEHDKDGERALFYDRNGRLIGTQLYDRKSGKRTFRIGNRIVPEDEFFFEINRLIYRIQRITP